MTARKTVLITRCSKGGIGSALAIEFQKHGLHVFATARNIAKMEHLASVTNVHLLSLDVTSIDSIEAAARIVSDQTGGKLDYLVNNAGVQYMSPAIDMPADLAGARFMFETNFWGVVSMCRAFAPLVIAAKGTIVNNGSFCAHINSPWMSVYYATKAAEQAFSETLRVELAPFGVKVVTVVTGAVATNIMTNASNAGGVEIPDDSPYKEAEKDIVDRATGQNENFRRKKPEDYAAAVVSKVRKGATGKIYEGQMSYASHVLSTWLPRWVWESMHLQGSGLEKIK